MGQGRRLLRPVRGLLLPVGVRARVGGQHRRLRRALAAAQGGGPRGRGSHLPVRPARGGQQPEPRRAPRHQGGRSGRRAAVDAGQAQEVRGPLPGHEPDRPLLALPQGLGHGPQAAGPLRAGVRAERDGRAGGQVLHRDGRQRRRRAGPAARHAPVGRDPDGAAVDHLRPVHADQAQGGAPHRQRQDHRRPRRPGADRGRRPGHRAVRAQRHHPQHPHQRPHRRQGRHDPGLPRALRVPDAVRRRRRQRVRLHQRLARPPLPRHLPGRPHRRHRRVHRRHHLQLPPHQPQRRHALRLQRQQPQGRHHADHRRLQPLRPRPRAENAEVPMGILPRGEQRLHPLAHVRHWRQQGPDHPQPGQPLHRAAQPGRQADHQADRLGGAGVEELGVALAGRPAHERGLLHRDRRRHQEEVRQGRPHQAQAGNIRHQAHALRRLHPLQARQALLNLARCTSRPDRLDYFLISKLYSFVMFNFFLHLNSYMCSC